MRPGRLAGAGLAAALLAIAPPARALEGRVVLPDGSAPRGATVSVVGRPGSTPVDAGGRFRWEPDPVAPFELLVVLGDGRVVPPQRFERWRPGEPVVVRVVPAHTESVTVAAGAAPHVESTPASAVTTLAREDLRQRHARNLTEAMELLPGAGRLGDPRASVPSLRGLARGRTLVLLDGGRVTTERRTGPGASFLDPFFLEGLEVSRGPGSAVYGSDAFGGVLDARSRRPDPDAPFAFRFEGSLGTGVPETRGALEIEQGFGDGGLLVQAYAREFDDYRSPRGPVANSGAGFRGFRVRWDQRLGGGLLSVGLQTDDGRDIGKPRIDSDRRWNGYPREDADRLTLGWEAPPAAGFSRLGMDGFVGSYRLLLQQDRLDGGALESRATSDVSAHDFGLRGFAERAAGRVRLEMGADLNGRFGLRAEGSELQPDGTGALAGTTETKIEDAGRIDTGLYLNAEAPLGTWVTLAGGARADHVTTRNRGGVFGDRATDHDSVSGFAALTLGARNGLRGTLQVARGFRDPTLSDRYFAGATGRGTITGNPDLDPETSLQLDLSLQQSGGRFRWAFYAYRYRIDDLIERYEAVEDAFLFRNRGRALLRGLELEAQVDAGRGLSLDLGAHVARGEALDDGAPLDDVPAARLTAQLRQEIGAHAYVLTRGSYQARDERPGPTETETPAFATLDLGGGFRLGGGAELRLWLQNVLDEEFPATADRRSELAPGRAAVATLHLAFPSPKGR